MTAQMHDRLLYRIPEAAEVLGISRSRIYELVRSGDLHGVRVGASLRIPRQELEDFTARLMEAAEVVQR